MSKAHVINEFGSPEVMHWRDWNVPDPSPGEVRLRHTAIGVNFADTYHRGGISHPWKVDNPPVVIGFEGVGLIYTCMSMMYSISFQNIVDSSIFLSFLN